MIIAWQIKKNLNSQMFFSMILGDLWNLQRLENLLPGVVPVTVGFTSFDAELCGVGEMPPPKIHEFVPHKRDQFKKWNLRILSSNH